MNKNIAIDEIRTRFPYENISGHFQVKWGDSIWSGVTSGHVMVLEKRQSDYRWLDEKSRPKETSVRDLLSTPREGVEVDLDAFRKWAECEVIKENCRNCDGTGRDTCFHCESEIDCDECNDGVIVKETFIGLLCDSAIINRYWLHIALSALPELARAQLSIPGKTQPVFIEGDEALIVVMPMNVDVEDDTPRFPARA